MEEAQKDERKENQGDGRFIQRVVYTQYCEYNAKMDGYANISSDIPELYAISRRSVNEDSVNSR